MRGLGELCGGVEARANVVRGLAVFDQLGQRSLEMEDFSKKKGPGRRVGYLSL